MNMDNFMDWVNDSNPYQPEFIQAVHEIAQDVVPYIQKHPEYEEARILERMVEPDRTITFRVAWEDDKGKIRLNRGYRVQFNKAIGPYKGGLRFDSSVNLSVLKFLGFEQTFKNSLTTLPIGSAKGGSDFSSRGKSDREVMRFCQSFMTELHRHIGASTDVPAGDIGVGAREIGYLFGQYNRLSNEVTGVLTGKQIEHGGSEIRTEATGYGCVYFAEEILLNIGDSLEGKTCVVSGSGNVAQYAVEKLMEKGARVVSMSDRGGAIYDPQGLNQEKLEFIIDLKTRQRGELSVAAQQYDLKYLKGKNPWDIPCDIAFPCATQNEIQRSDAQSLVKNGCKMVCEAANMPTTPEAVEVIREAGLLYAPAKAANAGGVAVSALEMSQNSLGYFFTGDEIDTELRDIMSRVHEQCVQYGETFSVA
jgi:glutamate dehydrogenase (NADP+)